MIGKDYMLNTLDIVRSGFSVDHKEVAFFETEIVFRWFDCYVRFKCNWTLRWL